MDVARVLREAERAVQEAAVSDDLRTIAFSKAVDLLAAAETQSGATTAGDAEGVVDPLSRIAARLGVSRGRVRQIYRAADGKLELTLEAGALPLDKVTATKEIALLLAAGRQIAYQEDATSVGVIADVCQEYQAYDPKSFLLTVTSLEKLFAIRGLGRDAEVKVRADGYVEAAALVRRLSTD